VSTIVFVAIVLGIRNRGQYCVAVVASMGLIKPNVTLTTHLIGLFH
jgi:hypothetical protein